MAEKNKKSKVEKESPEGKLAVVLVRGLVKVPRPIKETLFLMNLTRKNHCVVLDNNLVNQGMLTKVKDYITWGEISSETFKELIQKRGEPFLQREGDSKSKYTYNCLVAEDKKYKKYFRLNPPRKGFGRKGIKVSFNASGGLGYRGEKMNDLIKRML